MVLRLKFLLEIQRQLSAVAAIGDGAAEVTSLVAGGDLFGSGADDSL